MNALPFEVIDALPIIMEQHRAGMRSGNLPEVLPVSQLPINASDKAINDFCALSRIVFRRSYSEDPGALVSFRHMIRQKMAEDSGWRRRLIPYICLVLEGALMSSSYLRGTQLDDVIDFLYLTIDCSLFRLMVVVEDLERQGKRPDRTMHSVFSNSMKTLVEAIQRHLYACDAIINLELSLSEEQREWSDWLNHAMQSCLDAGWNVFAGSFGTHAMNLAVALKMDLTQFFLRLRSL